MDAVVVPGPAAEDAVLAMGVRPQNIYTGFNCVDMQPFLAVAESTTDTHARGGHRFLYLGQLIERKNVHTLLHSFARARADEDTLIIAGDGADRPRLLRLTEELGLYGSVHFAGHLPYTDLPSLMASADTLVLPSTEEVWGLVVNEALAAGCQVVVSTAAGVSRSVQRMTGVFVAEPTTDAMSDAMRDAKRQHSGRIQSPEIAAHDAAAFAGVFSDALRIERQSQ
jgi:glycosyltransferase involved in cell wall biosynthesis